MSQPSSTKPFKRLLLTGASGGLGTMLRDRIKPWADVVRRVGLGAGDGANGGRYAEPPLITFTPLANGKMEVCHVADQLTESKQTVLGAMPLAGNQGKWLVATETITYSNTRGRYQLAIRGMDGAPLLTIDQGGLQLWRTGADHMRPKWGIYRKHSPQLNQHRADTVYFSNMCITREEAAGVLR